LIDASVPAHLDVHVVLDTPPPTRRQRSSAGLFATRFSFHFTPTYSSSLNLVERWFAELTAKWVRRGSHRSVRDLVASIRTWISNWSDAPKPLVWHKDRRRDPRQPRRLLPTH
jgi:transposase